MVVVVDPSPSSGSAGSLAIHVGWNQLYVGDGGAISRQTPTGTSWRRGDI